MTHEKDFIGQLESYLDEYEGATPLPEAVRDAIRADLPTTKQIGPLSGPMRYPSMSTMPMAARFGLAAAVLVAAAVLAATILYRGENVGGQGADDGTSSPTASPASVLPESGALEPGRYFFTTEGPRVTITVPEGWEGGGRLAVRGDDPTRDAVISTWVVENVYSDPCLQTRPSPAIGPSAEDLAQGLASRSTGVESEPVDVDIDGYPAKLVVLSVPDDIDLANCASGQFRSWMEPGGSSVRYHQGPGQVDEILAVDVDGARAVIDVSYFAPISAEERAELDAIIDSIEIDP
jgi:hypothetical protein